MAASWFRREVTLGNVLSVGTILVTATAFIVTASVRGDEDRRQIEALTIRVAAVEAYVGAVTARVAVVEAHVDGIMTAIELGNARYDAIANALGAIRVDVGRLQVLLRDISGARAE